MTKFKMKSTGNKTVDLLIGTEFNGNIIPQSWYQTLAKENGKPQLNAIILLAEIVYWYRPVEKYDADNKKFLGYGKKFNSDLLQMSYKQISEKFGLSKSQTRDALTFLEDLNVVKRVFRTIVVNNLKLSNVMFLDLNYEGLRKITFPEIETDEKLDEEKEDTPGEKRGSAPKENHISLDKRTNVFERLTPSSEINDHPPLCDNEAVFEHLTPLSEINDYPPSSEINDYPLRNNRPGCPQNLTTNTKTTTKTTTKTIYPILSSNSDNNDRLDMIDKNHDLVMRKEYQNYYEKKLELESLRLNFPYEAEKINNILEILVDISIKKDCKIQVNGCPTFIEIVKSRFMKLGYQHMEYILECLNKNTTKIKNIKNYLITTIYNAPATIDHYYSQEVNHDMAELYS